MKTPESRLCHRQGRVIACASDRPKWPLPAISETQKCDGRWQLQPREPGSQKAIHYPSCSPKPGGEGAEADRHRQGVALRAACSICGATLKVEKDRSTTSPCHRYKEPFLGCLQNPTEGGGPQRCISRSSESSVPAATIFSDPPTVRTFLFPAIVLPVL